MRIGNSCAAVTGYDFPRPISENRSVGRGGEGGKEVCGLGKSSAPKARSQNISTVHSHSSPRVRDGEKTSSQKRRMRDRLRLPRWFLPSRRVPVSRFQIQETHMNKTSLACAAFVASASLATAAVIDFDDLTVPAAGYENGANLAGAFTSGGASFNNYFSTDFGYWEGFAYSTKGNTTTAGFGNQYSAWSGGGSDAVAARSREMFSRSDISASPFRRSRSGPRNRDRSPCASRTPPTPRSR